MDKDNSNLRILLRYLLTIVAAHGYIKSDAIEIFVPILAAAAIEIWSRYEKKANSVQVESLKTAVVETQHEAAILTQTIVNNDVPIPAIPEKSLTPLETIEITKPKP